MADDVVLSTEALCLYYGSFAAVRDVSLEVRRGLIHSVIGPNGAGKTSLFHCLAGTRTPTSGRISFEGRDIARQPAHRRVAAGMGRSFQVTALFQNLTVRENLRLAAQGRSMAHALRFWAAISSLPGHDRVADEVLERLQMHDRAEAKAGELSHGQQRLLEVGMALAAKPRLLLLDEPTSGMGIDDVPTMTCLIKELAEDHTIVLIEHNMGIVMSISDRITVMQQGKVLVEGTPDEVRRDQRVREAYLGEAA